MNPQNMPRTIEIPNGQKVVATFSKQELSNRLAKLRATKQSRGDKRVSKTIILF